MKINNNSLFITSVLSVFLFGCSTLPFQAEVKDEHFRLENFKDDKGKDIDYVYLNCFHKRPTAWSEPKQFEAGEHDLWVRAVTARRGVGNSKKEAFVNFKMELEAGKSYMFNRKFTDDEASIWIQESASGKVVSDVLTAKLRTPLIIDDNLRKTQCESGSV